MLASFIIQQWRLRPVKIREERGSEWVSGCGRERGVDREREREREKER